MSNKPARERECRAQQRPRNDEREDTADDKKMISGVAEFYGVSEQTISEQLDKFSGDDDDDDTEKLEVTRETLEEAFVRFRSPDTNVLIDKAIAQLLAGDEPNGLATRQVAIDTLNNNNNKSTKKRDSPP